MDQNVIEMLAEEMRVTKDLARVAVTEAMGEIGKARKILVDMLPKYVAIKVRFLSRHSNKGGGLVFLLAEKGAEKYLIFRTLYDTNREWVESINVRRPPDTFLRIIRDFFEEHSTSIRIFDAQKLKESLELVLSPTSMQYIFELWDIPKHEIIETDNPADSLNTPTAILHSMFSSLLGETLFDDVNVELDYDFFTETQFSSLRESFGLDAPSDQKEKDKPSEKEIFESEGDGLRVYLKGQFVIDPVSGTPVKLLEVGSTATCEILDRSEVAESVARMIGAYAKGMWLPTRGRIVEVRKSSGDRSRIRLRVASGVYVDVLSYDDIKVRTTNPVSIETVLATPLPAPETSMFPLLIAVVLLAFLIIFLLMTR